MVNSYYLFCFVNVSYEYAAAIHCTLQNLLRPLIQKLAAIAPNRSVRQLGRQTAIGPEAAIL
jgi:hypothetical protein